MLNDCNLVTGGTGLLGSHVLLELAKQGAQVRSIYRDSKRLELTRKVFAGHAPNGDALFKSVEWVEADILDIPSLEKVFTAGVDRVYHCVGQLSFEESKRQELMDVNAQGTANMTALSMKYNVKKFIHVSSTITLSDKEDGSLIDETCFFQGEEPLSGYGISKFLGEMEVWRAFNEGLNAVIVNPGIILSAEVENPMITVMLSVLKRYQPRYYFPGSTGIISAEDVASAMCRLMAGEETGQRYVLVSENWTYRDLQDFLAKRIKARLPDRPLPKIIARILPKAYPFLKRFTNVKDFPSASFIKLLYKNCTYDNAKIKSAVSTDFKPLKPILEEICAGFLVKQSPDATSKKDEKKKQSSNGNA